MFCNRCKKDCKWKRAYDREFEGSRNFAIDKNREITRLKNELHTLDMIPELTTADYEILKVFKKDNNIPIILTMKPAINEAGCMCEMHFKYFEYNSQYGRPGQVMELNVDVITADNKVSSLFIHDFTGAERKGYGSLMMNDFLDYVKKHFGTALKIRGQLSFPDLDRGMEYTEYLKHFYRKFGFEIYDIPDSREKRIVLDLSKRKPTL